MATRKTTGSKKATTAAADAPADESEVPQEPANPADSPEAKAALDAATEAARAEAAARRDTIQSYVDQGYQFLGSGIDADGAQYVDVQKQGEAPSRVSIPSTGATMEGQPA